jgi:hypothetical protein
VGVSNCSTCTQTHKQRRISLIWTRIHNAQHFVSGLYTRDMKTVVHDFHLVVWDGPIRIVLHDIINQRQNSRALTPTPYEIIARQLNIECILACRNGCNSFWLWSKQILVGRSCWEPRLVRLVHTENEKDEEEWWRQLENCHNLVFCPQNSSEIAVEICGLRLVWSLVLLISHEDSFEKIGHPSTPSSGKTKLTA